MSPIHFHTASRIHPAPLARPFSKGLLMKRIHSLFLSFRLEDPSCAFDAPFSKGLLMKRTHSLFLSFRLEDPSCAFGALLLQGPTHGADSLSFPFISPRGSILRLWRGPSPRAYSWCGVLSFLSFRLEDPSCAFGAPLLQGATQLAKLLSFT